AQKAEVAQEAEAAQETEAAQEAEAAKEAEVAAKVAEKAAEESRVAELVAIVIENVLFEYDKSYLKSEFKTKLINSFADAENKDQLKVVVSGHADERGSNEYNLALGERRAFTVKRFLISLGLSEENISVISYGEEKPVDPRQNETAWEKNRRAETDFSD
ncbi:MAG: OmpA family protein, partial [Deltaproteobacteria bacterium]|nr:OmpA family protein [Deltaproteobacteria bacterium]